jgi:hypothetical protein
VIEVVKSSAAIVDDELHSNRSRRFTLYLAGVNTSPGKNSWDGGTLFNKIRVPKRMGRPKGQGARRWDNS